MQSNTGAGSKEWPKPVTDVRYSLSKEESGVWENVPGLPLQKRDLGIDGATRGEMTASVVRVTESSPLLDHGWRNDDLSFHLLYVQEGTITIGTSDGRKVSLSPGDCIHQPNLFSRNSFEFSAGCQLIELTGSAARLPGLVGPAHAQKPYLSIDSPEAYKAEDGPRRFFAYRDLGCAQTTERRIHNHIIRAVERIKGGTGWHFHTMSQLFIVFKGWGQLSVEGEGDILMKPGDAMCLPAGLKHDVPDFSADYSLMELCIPADYNTVATGRPA